MALIVPTMLSKADKSKISVHKVVEGTYTAFTDSGGTKYFQLDTYGSKDRKIHHKISQSIQFDEETARYLIKLISNELRL